MSKLLEQIVCCLQDIKSILYKAHASELKLCCFVYPFDGSGNTITITKGTTELNYFAGTIKNPAGEISNLRHSLLSEGETWLRSLYIYTNKDIYIQLDDEDKIPVTAAENFSATYQEFQNLKITVTGDTKIFVICCTSPHTLIDFSGVVTIKGSDSGILRTVSVDDNGNLVAVMKGEKPDTSLDTVALDANGKIISIMQGSTGNAVTQDGSNKLIAIMQGSTGIAISQDAANNLVAVMKGEYAGALETIALDSEQRMIARTLVSIDDVVRDYQTASASGVNESLNSSTVGTGKLWCITSVIAANISNWTDSITLQVGSPGSYINFHTDEDIPKAHYIEWHGEIWLEITEKIHALFTGLTIGDSMRIYTHGYQINAV